MRAIAVWRRGAGLAAALALSATGVVGCAATTTTADVRDCLVGSPLSFARRQGEPRAYGNLELTVSCSPKHPFELSEVSEGGDYPVLAVQRGGRNTCLHRRFKARGERCAVEVTFAPNNGLGRYWTEVYFQYAGEDEVFIATVTGDIT